MAVSETVPALSAAVVGTFGSTPLPQPARRRDVSRSRAHPSVQRLARIGLPGPK
jgi:hypothetical protein